MATVERGDVVLLNFNEIPAETMTKTRPVLIVQNNAGNRASPYTIIAAIHHETRKLLPINVSVSAGNGGLTKDSVIDLGHLYTVPITKLGVALGKLGFQHMVLVDRALKISLALR